jgi:hypothetical protein
METAAMAEEAQTEAIFVAKRFSSEAFVLCLNGIWRWFANLLMYAGAYLEG